MGVVHPWPFLLASNTVLLFKHLNLLVACGEQVCVCVMRVYLYPPGDWDRQRLAAGGGPSLLQEQGAGGQQQQEDATQAGQGPRGAGLRAGGERRGREARLSEQTQAPAPQRSTGGLLGAGAHAIWLTHQQPWTTCPDSYTMTLKTMASFVFCFIFNYHDTK